ncbi:hypothetical protein Cgig2_006283 [Carnegiea gigantea]|uniref:Uncharacterized protein n=1 Tax=Carnegiea gigantea TaxID=171969 RepID=A0A9Q1JPL0_9CARY|nr:hypothetical protein Cgig2_006283 [Carnegiea gigantea]
MLCTVVWSPTIEPTGHLRWNKSRGLDSGLGNRSIDGYKMWSLRLGALSFIMSITLIGSPIVCLFLILGAPARWLSMLYAISSGIDAWSLFPRRLSRTIFRHCALVMNLLWPRELLDASHFQNYPIEAKRLGMLHGQTLHIMESALTELRWSTFEA